MRQRPVMVGMVNPLSTRPENAMEPYTPNGSGERMWKMVCAECSVSREDYARAFEFFNVVGGTRRWMAHRARAAREDNLRRIAGRGGVVLGRQAWASLGLPPVGWLERAGDLWLVPHPSGRSRAYNDAAMRRRAGRLVAAIGGLDSDGSGSGRL